MRSIIVTGGTGFIGSHTCLLLLNNGFKLYIIDSEVNSSKNVLGQLSEILNFDSEEFRKKIVFFKGDIRNINIIENVFETSKEKNEKIEAVFHFAGLKSVRESNILPIKYWDNNVIGTMNLLKTMDKYDCKTLIFSSSATIYEPVKNRKLNEKDKLGPINIYGQTKLVIEDILQGIFNSSPEKWKIANLRYFNPIGAHKSGKIGEDPIGDADNIFPIIIDVANRKLEFLKIFGNNWGTPDGTCIRDYIHIMDLAEGHIAAFKFLLGNKPQIVNLNLGTGKGHSVLELVKTFQLANNIKVPYEFTARREGDTEYLVADNSLAISLLNWIPKFTLYDMCKDGWNWGKIKTKF